jgi:hypothetical protein
MPELTRSSIQGSTPNLWIRETRLSVFMQAKEDIRDHKPTGINAVEAAMTICKVAVRCG